MDDEIMIHGTVSNTLEQLGYTCICTKNGQEALEYFYNTEKEGSPFQAIILDLTIPGGIGGIEVAKEIRKIDTNIPLFIISGYSEDPAIAKPHRYGFNDSIRKPFTSSELAALLQKNLS